VSLSRKQRARQRRRLAVLGAAVSAGVILLLAGLVFLITASGSGDANTAGTEPTAPANSTAPVAQPTAHPRSKIGALQEGSVTLAADAPVPPAGELRANGGKRFANPVAAFAAIDDWFGTPRQYGTVHGGVDFGLEGMGAVPVLAGCDGTVTDAATDAAYGPHVTLDCGDGWTMLAAYLGSVSASKGAAVVRGAQIGVSDSSDLFVHVEIRWQGQPVDPEGYLSLPERPRPTPTPTPAVQVEQPAGPAATATPTRRPQSTAG
jgi:murein DD-endopeptidase MepM/ murein hydrolase activator NlpD